MRRTLLHGFAPVLHARLSLLQESLVCPGRQTRHEFTENAAAIADQANLHGKSQADASGIQFDLHSARLTGLRQELNVRKGGADHQQGVAIFHHVLRRARAQQTDTAGGIRTVVGDSGFPQKRLDDWGTEHFRQLL